MDMINGAIIHAASILRLFGPFFSGLHLLLHIVIFVQVLYW